MKVPIYTATPPREDFVQEYLCVKAVRKAFNSLTECSAKIKDDGVKMLKRVERQVKTVKNSVSFALSCLWH